MAMTILATSAAVKGLHVAADGMLARRTQAWRKR
jgi:hypothetical protein